MNEEILAGLKNAMERGTSLEAAVDSFINAGYNPLEVKEAAQIITGNTVITESSIKEQVKFSSNSPSPPPYAVQNPFPVVSPNSKLISTQPHKKGGNALVFILLFVLIILIGAFVGVMLYSDEILKFLQVK
jgi:hypothetical protein